MGLELSLKELLALERRGLGNGLKFLKSSIKIPAPEIVAAAEEGSSRLLLDQKGMVRSEVDHIPRPAKPRPENISKDVFKALLNS